MNSTNLNLGLQSLNLSAAFGYGNTEVTTGVKEEGGYKVAYIQSTQTMKTDFVSLTNVNETGLRSPSDVERITEAGKVTSGIVAVGVFVAFALPAVVTTFSTLTFGKIAGISASAIGALITTKQISDKNKSKDQKKIKDKNKD